MNQDLARHMYRGKMRAFRIVLLRACTFGASYAPSLISGGMFNPYVGAWAGDPKVIALWQNAREPEAKRQDHNTLMRDLGLLAA